MLIVNFDNGHGIDTPGKRSPKWDNGKQLFEWSWTREIVDIASRLESKYRWESNILVPEEWDVSLAERQRRVNELVNRYPRDNFLTLSIHGNAYKKNIGRGIEVYTSPGQTPSDIYATFLLNIYKDVYHRKLRTDWSDEDPDKEERFAMVMVKGPAALTESGFYTHFEECMWMLSPEGKLEIAEAHVRAIDKYYSYLINQDKRK